MSFCIIGTGTSISFASGFFANITDISGPAGSRESIQCSTMATTTAHDFTPATLVDWGEMTVEIAFDPTATIPINAAAETIVITFPNSGASTWTFDGFMTGFEISVPLEDKMTGSATIKVTGDVTEG